MKRPSWDEYFMEIAHIVKKRSTCLRRQIGAVSVRDHRILTTGYNGAPPGTPHCSELGGCLREELQVPSGERHELCRALHSEQNVIIQAAATSTCIADSTFYSTTQPCTLCAKMIIGAGVKRLVYEGDYPDELALTLLEESGIELVRFGEIDK